MTYETSMKRSAMAMIALLCVQFLLGMVVNFYAVIPTSHPGAHSAHYFTGLVRGVIWSIAGSGMGFLVAHAALGLLLALGSIWMVVASFLSSRRSMIVSSLIAWFGVFAAGFNGGSFLNYGHDFSSLIMSVAFLVALASYAVGVYCAR